MPYGLTCSRLLVRYKLSFEFDSAGEEDDILCEFDGNWNMLFFRESGRDMKCTTPVNSQGLILSSPSDLAQLQ
ncbi:hypothetical protein PROFUN_14446 [Planoprotostelium fungivorum]|uniref:Uncharacterized protein n=1 Tax=Planoprotostelium fungivorum TaxID=1890364 RepID=A0A2P6MXB0_9EUKA|nr:hypothetical protein PROFUN_14446 [Planoprotostelium fungivorum]